MNPNYRDIISRIGTMPNWFDENAVPRYCSFEPARAANIYIGEVALMEITCQECGRPFMVAISAVNHTDGTIAHAIRNRTLHYGDPPAHCWEGSPFGDCIAGDSENSEPRRVLEYWHRHDPRYVDGNRVTDPKYMDWVRDHSLEVDIQQSWASDRRE